MSIKQLSVFVENMSVADTQQFGIIRMIVDDIATAKQKLSDRNLFVKTTDVVGVAVSDEPGGLARAVRVLADNKINIDYLYAFISVSKKNAYVVLRVDENDAAEKVLVENGFKLVTDDDISTL